MSDYTPTTHDVYEAWIDEGSGPFLGGTPKEFHRWLAERDRETAAKAWDACVSAMTYQDGTPVEILANQNPFRGERSGA